jgi:hypothetical protein
MYLLVESVNSLAPSLRRGELTTMKTIIWNKNYSKIIQKICYFLRRLMIALAMK